MGSVQRSRRLAPNLPPGKVELLAMPPPYRAWLTVSNDPDNTTASAWKELHTHIWEELGLPFGDALFVSSHNCNLPEQVNLRDNPEIATAHHHDTLHGWGDYVHSRRRGFDREDAVRAIALLDAHRLRPRVWVDHSTHPQNMLHNSTAGSTPQSVDGSGTVYRSFTYTLDLAANFGIRYFWDGKVSEILGQDLPISPRYWYSRGQSSRLKASLLTLLHWLSALGVTRAGRSRLTYDENVNRQYFAHKFADGNIFYCFRRYGTWKDADIDGLADLIAPRNIERLIERQATCVVYTHLGKRRADRKQDKMHIPPATRAALAHVKRKYDEGKLKLSPVSTLLDYLVIRDNIEVAPDGSSIDFRPDGIRFQSLGLRDLASHTFGFRPANPAYAEKLTIRVSGQPVDAQLNAHGDGCYSVSFPRVATSTTGPAIDFPLSLPHFDRAAADSRVGA